MCLLFSVLGLTVGHLVPGLARVEHRQAVAAATYGALMYLPAAAFAWLVSSRVRQVRPSSA